MAHRSHLCIDGGANPPEDLLRIPFVPWPILVSLAWMPTQIPSRICSEPLLFHGPSLRDEQGTPSSRLATLPCDDLPPHPGGDGGRNQDPPMTNNLSIPQGAKGSEHPNDQGISSSIHAASLLQLHCCSSSAPAPLLQPHCSSSLAPAPCCSSIAPAFSCTSIAPAPLLQLYCSSFIPAAPLL